MTELHSAGQAVRKPRKKKVKPAHVLVSKMNYCASSDTLTSIDPKGIIGASQRNIMKCLTTKEAKATGRINAETILLRVLK